MNQEEDNQEENNQLELVSLIKKSLIMNFLYKKFFKTIVNLNCFQQNKHSFKFFYALFTMIIGILAIFLSFFWSQTLVLYLAAKSFTWFYIYYRIIQPTVATATVATTTVATTNDDINKLIEYYSVFFSIIMVRSISSVSMHFLPTFIIFSSIILTIKLMGDSLARKQLYQFIQNKMTKPLDELHSISQLLCHIFECAIYCANNSLKIFTVTGITDFSDLVNNLSVLATNPNLNSIDNVNNVNNINNIDDTNETNSNEVDSNDTDSCDLDETL